jgi:predicted dehydrogenase
MKACVVGYGSIGSRHARILKQLGCDVAVVSRRPEVHPVSFINIAEAIDQHLPDYVVIASRTSEHADDIAALINSGFSGQVLVEKPLSATPHQISDNQFSGSYVAYNLRFHPVIARLKSLLNHVSLIAVHAHVGQYLPDWRPQSDYRTSYSAKSSEGGGVLRDLSHELDYLTWMLGSWTRLAALGGHLSSLEIDSDDIASILMETTKCPIVTVQLNYLDTKLRREIIAITEKGTYRACLVSGTIEFEAEKESYDVNRDDTYIAEHEAVIANNTDVLCTFHEAIKTMEFIGAVEKSINTNSWISNE